MISCFSLLALSSMLLCRCWHCHQCCFLVAGTDGFSMSHRTRITCCSSGWFSISLRCRGRPSLNDLRDLVDFELLWIVDSVDCLWFLVSLPTRSSFHSYFISSVLTRGDLVTYTRKKYFADYFLHLLHYRIDSSFLNCDRTAANVVPAKIVRWDSGIVGI